MSDTKAIAESIIENFILWYTHKNNEEGHMLYDALEDYLESGEDFSFIGEAVNHEG